MFNFFETDGDFFILWEAVYEDDDGNEIKEVAVCKWQLAFKDNSKKNPPNRTLKGYRNDQRVEDINVTPIFEFYLNKLRDVFAVEKYTQSFPDRRDELMTMAYSSAYTAMVKYKKEDLEAQGLTPAALRGRGRGRGRGGGRGGGRGRGRGDDGDGDGDGDGDDDDGGDGDLRGQFDEVGDNQGELENDENQGDGKQELENEATPSRKRKDPPSSSSSESGDAPLATNDEIVDMQDEIGYLTGCRLYLEEALEIVGLEAGDEPDFVEALRTNTFLVKVFKSGIRSLMNRREREAREKREREAREKMEREAQEQREREAEERRAMEAEE